MTQRFDDAELKTVNEIHDAYAGISDDDRRKLMGIKKTPTRAELKYFFDGMKGGGKGRVPPSRMPRPGQVQAPVQGKPNVSPEALAEALRLLGYDPNTVLRKPEPEPPNPFRI